MRCADFKTSYVADEAIFQSPFVKCWIGVLFAALIIFPFLVGAYELYIANLIGFAVIAAVGLNILTGFTGQISLGHAAFIGIGGYTAAILITRLNCPFWLALPAAGLVSAAAGVVIGIASLRVKGLYLCVGALEPEACRALAVEPMQRLNISWESEALVQRLIEQAGQRANLISVTCDQLLYELGLEERRISSSHLEKVLSGSRLRDGLVLRDLSTDPIENRLDRITVYTAASDANKPRFTLADIITQLERQAYNPSAEALKRSLERLVLAFVLGRQGNEYFFQVPLQLDLIMGENTALLLQSELKATKGA